MISRTRIENLGKNYMGSQGTAWRLTNKLGASIVVTEHAGRIISAGINGKEAIWANPAEMFPKLPGIVEKCLDQGRSAVTWDDMNGTGGAKILIAPQGEGVPYPVPNIGFFEADVFEFEKVNEKGVIMTSPLCPESNFQVIRTITVSNQDDSFIDTSSLTYYGKQPIQAAPWLVTQFRLSAVVTLPNLAITPEPFTCFGENLPADVLSRLGQDSFKFSLKLGRPDMFKAGYRYLPGPKEAKIFFPESGIALTLRLDSQGGDQFPHGPNGGYEGELFCCDKYFEHEFLGPLETLQPGQTSSSLRYHFWLSQL